MTNRLGAPQAGGTGESPDSRNCRFRGGAADGGFGGGPPIPAIVGSGAALLVGDIEVSPDSRW